MFFLDNGILSRLPDTLEEAVSFVEPFRILDRTGVKRKSASPMDESDTSFINDLNNENEADDSDISDEESSTPSSSHKLPSLQKRLGYTDDKDAWLDFRVIAFFQTLSNWI
jgi:hypothetical protein